jgi:hypothetical protein
LTRSIRWPRPLAARSVFALALLALVALASSAGSARSEPTPSNSAPSDQTPSAQAPTAATQATPCTDPEFALLDFWLGEWDLTWEGGTGTNVVTREFGGCVIHENFHSEGLIGSSVSVWIPRLGTWKQTWVDDSGSYLDFTGGPTEDGRFVFSRELPPQAKSTHQRMVFHDITADSLVWDWQSSADGGETWAMQWQIHYRRRT